MFISLRLDGASKAYAVVYIVFVLKSDRNTKLKLSSVITMYAVEYIVFAKSEGYTKLILSSVIRTYAVVYIVFVKFEKFMKYKWLIENELWEFTNGS